jgi:hypothetical protein
MPILILPLIADTLESTLAEMPKLFALLDAALLEQANVEDTD